MKIISVNRCGECPYATMSKKKWVCIKNTNQGIADLSVIAPFCSLVECDSFDAKE